MPRATFRAKGHKQQVKKHGDTSHTIRYTGHDGAYVSTTSRSSTLPVGPRDSLERAHMGSNTHLHKRH